MFHLLPQCLLLLVWAAVSTSAFASYRVVTKPSLLPSTSHMGPSHSYLSVGSCGEARIVVRYRNYEDYKMACDGIRRARGFFQEAGLDTRKTVKITFVNPENSHFQTEGYLYNAASIFGLFDKKRNEVFLKEYNSESFQKSKNDHFRLKLSQRDDFSPVEKNLIVKEIFVSIVAHEVAHLYAEANFLRNNSGVGVHEFVAYTVQFDTMNEQVRELILEQYTNEMFRGEYMINGTNFFLAPESYGVRSYKWYISPNGGQRFLERIFEEAFDMDSLFETSV